MPTLAVTCTLKIYRTISFLLTLLFTFTLMQLPRIQPTTSPLRFFFIYANIIKKIISIKNLARLLSKIDTESLFMVHKNNRKQKTEEKK